MDKNGDAGDEGEDINAAEGGAIQKAWRSARRHGFCHLADSREP